MCPKLPIFATEVISTVNAGTAEMFHNFDNCKTASVFVWKLHEAHFEERSLHLRLFLAQKYEQCYIQYLRTISMLPIKIFLKNYSWLVCIF